MKTGILWTVLLYYVGFVTGVLAAVIFTELNISFWWVVITIWVSLVIVTQVIARCPAFQEPGNAPGKEGYHV